MLDYRTWAIGDLQKSEFSFLETSLQWFPLAEFLKCRHFFEWNSWRWHQSLSKRKKKICFLVSMSSINKFMREQTLLVVRHLAQGSKKISSGTPGQEDFLFKVVGKSSSNKIITTKTNKEWPGQADCESCLPEVQAGIHFFSRALRA